MATFNTDDKIPVVRVHGGQAQEFITIDELNTLISTEEQSELTDLQAQVGSYDPDVTSSTITADLALLQSEVETETTGLLDRTTAAEGDIDDLETDSASMLDREIATKAHAKLTIAATPGEGEKVTVGTIDYRFRLDALSETGVKAFETLTAAGQPSANDTVSIGTAGKEKVYKFVAALTAPAVANEVVISAVNASGSLDNLIAAINGAAGAGTTYGTGTVAHTEVDAVAGDGDTVTITAKAYGVAGNLIACTCPVGTALSFGNAKLVGGVDPARDYDVYAQGSATNAAVNLTAAINATGTNETDYWGIETPAGAHDTCSAVNTGTGIVQVTARTAGTDGNLIPIAETLSNASSKWEGDAVYLSGGYAGTATLDIIDTTSDYTVTRQDSFIVIGTSSADNGDLITLPAATGTNRQIIISNQTAYTVTVNTNSTETINGTDNLAVTTFMSVVLVDYAAGKWLTI